MCHMKTIRDTTFDRKEGRVSQREEEWRGRGARGLSQRPALPLRLTCPRSGHPRGSPQQRLNLAWQGGHGRGALPLVHSLLVWIYCKEISAQSSQRGQTSIMPRNHTYHGLAVNSIGGKNLSCGTDFLRHAHFRYKLLSIRHSSTWLL